MDVIGRRRQFNLIYYFVAIKYWCAREKWSLPQLHTKYKHVHEKLSAWQCLMPTPQSSALSPSSYFIFFFLAFFVLSFAILILYGFQVEDAAMAICANFWGRHKCMSARASRSSHTHEIDWRVFFFFHFFLFSFHFPVVRGECCCRRQSARHSPYSRLAGGTLRLVFIIYYYEF